MRMCDVHAFQDSKMAMRTGVLPLRPRPTTECCGDSRSEAPCAFRGRKQRSDVMDE